MRTWNIILAVVAIALITLTLAGPTLIFASPSAPAPTLTPIPPVEKDALEAALRSAAESNQKAIPAFLLYKVVADRVEVSSDGKTALVWMALVDPQTKKVVATEPGLAIARRSDTRSQWKITLPTHVEWQSVLQGVPDSLMSKERKAIFTPSQSKDIALDTVYTGYFLPWEGGKRVWLTGSVAHFTTYNSCSYVTVDGDTHSTCRYAFDFSDGTMFRVLASRGGEVVGARWTCANSDHNCLNYIALEDRTTTPPTTALYLHLAQDSIPQALRTVGTYVNGGGFLGLADNTGLSTGHHLHFMVVRNAWLASGYGGTYWWGDSVDISFAEVDINGGRPRLCSEAYYTPQYGSQCHEANPAIGEYYDNWFISGNKGTTPPTATITAPTMYAAVGSTVTVSGSAQDNTGVSRIQVIANYDNNWIEVGPSITSNPFTTELDLCVAGVPNGPVTLALWAWDDEGNRSPLPQDPRPIFKNANCSAAPVLKCVPSANQVSLYSAVDYLGNCQVFNIGKYGNTQLGSVGDNQAVSIRVGANVMALAYAENYEDGKMKGRSEAFDGDDPSLADNPIGARTISSLEVKSRVKPSAPVLRTVLNQLGTSITSNDTVLLAWKGEYPSYPPDEGGTDYRVELTYPNGSKRYSPWQMGNSWMAGSLPAGNYTWTVTARNSAGETTATPVALSVAAAPALGGTTRSVPFTDNFESGVNGWTAGGIWRLAVPSAGNTTNGWGFNNGQDYADGSVAGGDLTSPPIAIPAGGAFLKFRYYSRTEDAWLYWDRREVLIAVDGEPFQEVLQLWDDPIGEWQSSPAIDLRAYAGKTIRVRFFFHIVDKFNNANAGWWIDDFTVSTSGGDAGCAELVSDNTPAQANGIALNSSANGVICPAGDVDYYQFTAEAGLTISVDVVAKTQSSALDPYLYLIDSDGASILAENDDIEYGVRQDSHLEYTIQRSGTYYLKVKAYNHLAVGGSTYFYRIVLKGDNVPPVVSILSPASNWLAAGTFTFEAQASDANGISRVDFYWHSSDWRYGTWELLATDTDGSDGWKTIVDPTGRTIAGAALQARAYDAAGLSSAWVVWGLAVDTYAPVTTMQVLPATTASTAVVVSWSGSDTGVGISSYELQYRDGSGAWTSWTSLSALYNQAIFVGTAGRTYGFRIRATDKAGNAEAFPTSAGATTTISATCQPDVFDASSPGDNTAANATLLELKTPQEHNFCPSGDEDWVRFSAQAGESYLIQARSLAGGAAANLAVTDAPGSTVLVSGAVPGLGQSAFLMFTAPADGEYRIRVRPADTRLWGSDARYAVSISAAKWNFLPIARVR